jgi:PIN domain nuclease of toxin-antitoxin system
MSDYLLDTHEWIWFMRGDATRLNQATVDEFLLWQRQGVLFVSDASIWEIALAVSKGRLTLGISVEDWVARSTVEGGLKRLPLTPAILIESTQLPDYPYKDPGDRMIMATALAHDLTLVTRDEKILTYSASGAVKVLER